MFCTGETCKRQEVEIGTLSTFFSRLMDGTSSVKKLQGTSPCVADEQCVHTLIHCLCPGFKSMQPVHLLKPDLKGKKEISMADLGGTFLFLERDTQVKEFGTVIMNTFKQWDETRAITDYKKRLEISCIGGCSGSGKTRFMREVMTMVHQLVDSKTELYSLLQNSVHRQLFLDLDISTLEASSSSLASEILQCYNCGFSQELLSYEDVNTLISLQGSGREMHALTKALQTAEGARDEDKLIIFLRFDEVNEDISVSRVRDMVSLALSTHKPMSNCLLIPVLSGTDIQKMQGASTGSGTQFKTFLLPPLSLPSMKKIVAAILPGFDRKIADNTLFNSIGPPRILQLLLWACANAGANMRKHLQSPRGDPPDSSGPILRASINLDDLAKFFSSATEADFSQAFKYAARNMKSSSLFRSFDDVFAHGDLLYAYGVTGFSVGLNEKVGAFTLNEWVTKGLVCVEPDNRSEKFFILVPYIVLFQIYESGGVSSNPILKVIKSPTLHLTDMDAEHLDLNIVLSRLYCAHLVKLESVPLNWLVPVEGVPVIHLQLPGREEDTVNHFKELDLDNPSERTTGKTLASKVQALEKEYGSRKFFAFVNGHKAACCDWFFIFKGAKIPQGTLERYPAQGWPTRNTPTLQPHTCEYFVLAGQSKRFKITKLTQKMFCQEYQKCLPIARHFGPFVLVVMTDARVCDQVPIALSNAVFCVAGEDLEYMQGPTLSQRRAASLLRSA